MESMYREIKSSHKIRIVPAKLLNPSVTMAVWWTKQSPDPSLGAMNPNPLVTSKNLTLPKLKVFYHD